MNRWRWIKIGCLTISITVNIGLLLPVGVHTRTRYNCLRCRMERTNYEVPGYHWRSSNTNEFTAWYDSHHPAHEHSWTRSSCIRQRNIFGLTVAWGCGPIHPIVHLPPQRERQFLEDADEPTREKFFQDICSESRVLQEEAVNNAWMLGISNPVP